jgi:hypothetical protein
MFENLTIEPISANSARLRWDQTVDLDVKTGGRIHIRHTNLTDGTGTWSNSVDLIPCQMQVLSTLKRSCHWLRAKSYR